MSGIKSGLYNLKKQKIKMEIQTKHQIEIIDARIDELNRQKSSILEQMAWEEEFGPEMDIDIKKERDDEYNKEKNDDICTWCGEELNFMHDDEMCRYLNR